MWWISFPFVIYFSNVLPNILYAFKTLKYSIFPVQALVHVSKELSLGNFDTLEELFTKPTLEEIRRNFARLSLKQRLDLAVAEDDIFLSFPYQIGIIFTNEGRLYCCCCWRWYSLRWVEGSVGVIFYSWLCWNILYSSFRYKGNSFWQWIPLAIVN